MLPMTRSTITSGHKGGSHVFIRFRRAPGRCALPQLKPQCAWMLTIAQMVPVDPSDVSMTDAILDPNVNVDIMGGLNMGMIPMNMDLGAATSDAHAFRPDLPPPLQQHDQQRRLDTNNGISSAESAYQMQDEQDNIMSGIGAGPLPTGFGMQTSGGAGNTLTEFTKRRNWSQRVLEEIRDFLHILTPDGRILYISPSAKALTGYDATQLVGKFITEFIHSDDSGIFIREFNESIASGNPLRFFHRFRKADQSFTIFESHGHPHLSSEAATFGTNSGAGFCRGFFMMSRPYPTKNAALLDSFLEHKIENERLRKRIEDLRREEAEENENASQAWVKKEGGYTSVTPSESMARTETRDDVGTPASAQPRPPTDYGGMPPPAKPSFSSNALTRQNLDEVLASSKPDSINDKMARYEGATHIETIEMLTGLRYREGERSQGLSTGDVSPALIRGDVGIPVQMDKDTREKKKKNKVVDEYVCTDCGTLDSPEWRKGPNGPKTLCNACGCKSQPKTGDDVDSWPSR